MKELFEKYGIGELLFTSDGGKELVDGTLPGVFEMVNLQNHVDENLNKLQQHQPGKYIFCFNRVEDRSKAFTFIMHNLNVYCLFMQENL